MKNLIPLLILFLSVQFTTQAQKEANIWYFGVNAGLDFNSGAPVALTDGAMTTLEGCASIADQFGVLRFYTDGISVWNRFHTVMPNGTSLNGNPSSSQSGVIVPHPTDKNIYFIITVDGVTGGRKGYHYSIVDMTLDGGKGDVTTKNTILHATSDNECIAAVLHSNRRDIWVVIKPNYTDEFWAYQITSTGWPTTKVVSTAGPDLTSTTLRRGTNCMKASPDGSMLAVGICSQNFYLFDFDNATGAVSGAKRIDTMGFWGSPYGVEFSPNSEILYASNAVAPPGGTTGVFQYDVTLATESAIRASKLKVSPTGSTRFGTLQLGPDLKMYLATLGSITLDVIHDPNEWGSLCDYRAADLALSGKRCNYGLPAFIQSYFNPVNFTFHNICLGDTTFFDVAGDTTIYEWVTWNFGEPSSGSANVDSGFHVWHIYGDTGTYEVCAVSKDTSGYYDTTCVLVTILTDPVIQIPEDTILCDGDNWEIAPVFSSELSWLWSDSSVDSSFTISSAGTYWAQNANPCGMDRDSIVVVYHSPLSPDLGTDQDLCDGETRTLDVTAGSEVKYLWSTGDTTASITINSPGTYFVEMTNACGTYTDSIEVTYTSPPTALLPQQDTIVCFGDDLLLQSGNPGEDVTWPDGSKGSTFTVSEPGAYWLQVDNFCGSDVDSLWVDFDNCCAVGIPNAFSPNEDGLNDNFSLIHDYCPISNFELTIYNRLGQIVFESTDPDEKWDGTKGGKELDLGVYVYKLRYTLEGPTGNGSIPVGTPQFLSGNVTLIR